MAPVRQHFLTLPILMQHNGGTDMAGAYHNIVPFDGMWIVRMIACIFHYDCSVIGYE